MDVPKTHEVCWRCHGWLSLSEPYVTARIDGVKVYLHTGFCFSYAYAVLEELDFHNYPDLRNVYGD